MQGLRRYLPLLMLVLFISVFMARAWWPSSSPDGKDVQQDLAGGYADILVTHVFDGDTLKLADGQRVRLIGIDTPESRENEKLMRDVRRSGDNVEDVLRMGRQAAEYTRSLLDGQRVRLVFDIERRDKYGRLLAYVYRAQDDLFINAEIIRNGYAYPMTIAPNVRHADEFVALFRQARQARRGLWGR